MITTWCYDSGELSYPLEKRDEVQVIPLWHAHGSPITDAWFLDAFNDLRDVDLTPFMLKGAKRFGFSPFYVPDHRLLFYFVSHGPYPTVGMDPVARAAEAMLEVRTNHRPPNINQFFPADLVRDFAGDQTAMWVATQIGILREVGYNFNIYTDHQDFNKEMRRIHKEATRGDAIAAQRPARAEFDRLMTNYDWTATNG
jgi:hypothetical protein